MRYAGNQTGRFLLGNLTEDSFVRAGRILKMNNETSGGFVTRKPVSDGPRPPPVRWRQAQIKRINEMQRLFQFLSHAIYGVGLIFTTMFISFSAIGYIGIYADYLNKSQEIVLEQSHEDFLDYWDAKIKEQLKELERRQNFREGKVPA